MSLHDSFLKLKFDKRMKTWNLNQELVTKEEFKENLENLKDISENAEPMVLFSDPATTDQQPSQTTPETQASQTQAPQTQAPQIQAPQITSQIQTPQQAPQMPQTQQEQTLSKDNDTAYNTQPSTAPDQTDPTPNKDIATEEATNIEEKDTAQKTNEDPSNPWW